jgi:hypothetical protein
MSTDEQIAAMLASLSEIISELSGSLRLAGSPYGGEAAERAGRELMTARKHWLRDHGIEPRLN